MAGRHYYLSRGWMRCVECEEDFISVRGVTTCASCRRRISYEPWNHAESMYRALREDEDLLENGLQPQNANANFTISDHVEHGSYVETQFISMTGSLAAAAFFAARGGNTRIAVFDAPLEIDEFRADEREALAPRAQNFARIFDEYIFTEDEARENLTLNYIIDIYPKMLEIVMQDTHNFRSFRAQYNGSQLQEKIVRAMSDPIRTLVVELEIVGLRHYIHQRPAQILKVRLVLDNDNAYDQNNAIQVQGRHYSNEEWVCVGYLASEHASVTRRIFKHSNNEYQLVELPDFDHEYETSIRMQFSAPSKELNRLIDAVRNVCGNAHEKVNLSIMP